MSVGLADWQLGSDPLVPWFALQSGNIRAYELPYPPLRPREWTMIDPGREALMEMLSGYRLPPSIHDLMVTDLHRRFFQRLHRTPRPDEQGGNRNCDNMEITAGSPSYLITAGGQPATYAIDPTVFGVVVGDQAQQLGVAVTTSFMPAGRSAGSFFNASAIDLIQFGNFSDQVGDVANYGVAPDFACGHRVYLPSWVTGVNVGRFLFVDRGSPGPSEPGFYLAIYREGDFGLLEAFDTWLHPGMSFAQFQARVLAANGSISLQNNVEAYYTTLNGNRLRFVIWTGGVRANAAYAGAQVLGIQYGSGDPADAIGDAGNNSAAFLNGTVMGSPAESVVEIYNPGLRTKITLDLFDKWRPRRLSETGEVEEAGANHEVWVDFSWSGPTEGDFFRPFNSLASAYAAVAAGGVIRIMPGTTTEAIPLRGKRARLEAPIGNVRIGVRP
jgi:hypothetical protein